MTQSTHLVARKVVKARTQLLLSVSHQLSLSLSLFLTGHKQKIGLVNASIVVREGRRERPETP